MSSKVVPLRPEAPPKDDGKVKPRVVPRVISHMPGISQKELLDACNAQEQLILKYEAKLTAMVAKILVDHLPSIEEWVAAVLTSPGPEDEGDLVELAPRDHAIEVAQPWASIQSGLKEPPLPDRLDVIVEAQSVVGLVSFDVEPALPVTRKQAETANLPPHLLFARGDAFASLGEESANGATLQAAFEEHRRLLDEQQEEILDALRVASIKTPIAQCVGVLLSLGPDGNAVSAVTREQSLKILVDKPFLQRKLDRVGVTGQLKDGRDILAIPIVVWAKGHVSVQTRELVESK
jgi:hypothetical protein